MQFRRRERRTWKRACASVIAVIITHGKTMEIASNTFPEPVKGSRCCAYVGLRIGR
jgi:hypothetical protein